MGQKCLDWEQAHRYVGQVHGIHEKIWNDEVFSPPRHQDRQVKEMENRDGGQWNRVSRRPIWASLAHLASWRFKFFTFAPAFMSPALV
jgi:hypothetical protein